MIVVNVKTSQILPKVTNWRSQKGFYVDDTYAKGLEKCKFGTIITGLSGGQKAPVISYAGHVGATYTDIGAAPIALGAARTFGLIYETSPIDQYRRTDDLSDETRLFPKGPRTDKQYALMPSGVLEIIDTEEFFGNGNYFREVDYVPTEAATAFDDATATITYAGNLTTAIKVEDRLEIDGASYYVVDIVYDSVGNETTITLNEGAGDIVLPVTVKGQIYDDLFLADDMTGDVPFTTVPTDSLGNARQKVGYVESGMAMRYSVLDII